MTDHVPRFTWINHASFAISTANSVLLVDPWFTGTVFDNGWSLHSSSVWDPALIADLTDIWYSHEHPDHFHPRTLATLPVPDPGAVTIHLRRGANARMVSYCKDLGFAVRELRPGTWHPISDDLAILCNPWRNSDSYLAVRTACGVILDLNDCVLRTERDLLALASDIDTDVAVLVTQFSYSNQAGTPDRPGPRVRAARDALDAVELQTRVLRPDFVVPSASHFWFSHEENEYMNDHLTRVAEVVARINSIGTSFPIVLSPGESWRMDRTPPDPTRPAAELDSDRLRAIRSGERSLSTPPLAWCELRRLGRDMARDLRSANGRIGLGLLVVSRWLRPVHVWLTDRNEAVTLSVHGIEMSPRAHGACDVVMASEPLAFLMRHRFGGSTLMSNARFVVAEHGEPAYLYRLIRLRDANNLDAGVGAMVQHALRRWIERRLPPRSRFGRSLRYRYRL